MSTSPTTEALERHAQQPSSFTSRYYSQRQETDRCLMMTGGLALAAIGLASRGLAGALLTAIGGYVAYKHADRGCSWSKLSETLSGPPQRPPYIEDTVDEASAGSFPASDPPSY